MFVVMALVFPSDCDTCGGPDFPGGGWTSACEWETGNGILFLLCFCVQLLLSLLNCRYCEVKFSCLPSILSPSHGRGEGARGWAGVWLLAGVEPPHLVSNPFCQDCSFCSMTGFM